MSTHPNAILLAALTPDGLARKTMRDILESAEPKMEAIRIGECDYNFLIMESDYDESFQIAANEGDLVFFSFVTYGYGEVIPWADLEKRKAQLLEWAERICLAHHCSFRIEVTANYW